MIAALGLGCLVTAALFVRRDRRDLDRQAASLRESALAHELIAAGVIADFVESTSTPCLRLETARADDDLDPFTSKLGGVFYLPPGSTWPLSAQQQPMWPLAQLNFAEFPHLDGFPERGILQFFITSDLYGIDLDDPTRQTGFRVVYHPSVDTFTWPNPPQPDPEELAMPFDGTFRLSARAATAPMTISDWRFGQAITDSWRRRTGDPGMNPDVVGAARRALMGSPDVGEDVVFGGHQIGGYPHFPMDDPRQDTARWRGHSTVLLQIDSTEDEDWEDPIVATFLIEPERLRRCDFSSVYYTWDAP